MDLVSERDFELRCECGVTWRADALLTREDRGATLDDCAHCGTSEGHRMCCFVFASKVDRTMWPPAATEAYMEIPARPLFFNVRGYE